MQNSSVKNPVSCIMRHASCIVFLILALLLPSLLYAAPQMADYCYLPPFVTDPNTPPNIMIVFDRTSYGKNRAYQGSYDSTKTYYGFFESSSKYTHNGTAFAKTTDAACTTQLTAENKYNCFSGNVLNFALMSTLDLARKAFIGFGWTPVSSDAGDNYSYSGATLTSYGASNASTVTVCNVSFSSGTYSYYFDIGNDGTGSTKASPVTIRVRNDSTCPTSSTGVVPANNKGIRVDYASGSTENRIGLIEKYSDKDKDLKDDYPTAGARFGMRRWKSGSGNDKATDIIDDSLSITATNRADYFKSILNTTSSSPSQDPGGSPLGDMMRDIVKYFSNQATTYSDGNSFTQSPYDWTKDPAASCRKNFAVFVSAGTDLTDSSPLSATCTSAATKYCTTSVATTCSVDGDCPLSGKCMVLSTSFSQDACYGYTTDLSTVAKTQNVRTYVVHTMAGITCTASKCTNNTSLACTIDEDCTNEAKLKFASSAGGGEYIKVDDPATLETKIEEAILNILSTSASASTVATLTTQTRESSTLTQAYFYPKRDGTPLRWIGYLRLLWSDSGANLREDTKNSGWLDLKNDNILSFFYDSDAIAYKAKTYADADGDLKIDSASCTVTATKLNDDVLPIWNAQTKLQSMMSPADRTIKIGIGASGKCSNNQSTSCTSDSDCTSSGVCQFILTGSQMYDFTTARASTLRPYWDSGSYCSDYTARWCGSDSGCNYCTTLRGTDAIDRGCSAAGDCYYCDGDKTKHCTTTLSCSDGVTVGCLNAGDVCGGTYVCVGDCYKYYGTCNTGGTLVCDIDNTTTCTGLNTSCTVGTDTTGTCKAKCTVDTTRLCTDAAGCIDDWAIAGSGCTTTDTCTAASAGTCIQGCDTNNCSTQVIKYVLGYDSPTNSSSAVASPGNAFRFRHETITTADNTNTLKLGDIVYSTPRISPNSAVNGYDVTYKDTTYSAFVNSRIKGKCNTNTTCPNTSDNTSSINESCTSGICTNDGYTPIVIVGANDGMVHAFKVSKIKDFSPAEDDCGGQACDSITTGYQTAAFVDKPNTVLGVGNPAPPADLGKELWGYIPFNAMPYLRWYCNTSYCHIPMLDARFSIVDVSIDYDKNGTVASEATETAGGGSSTTNRCSGASTSTCDCMPLVSGNCNYPWRRLLVGAMGAGGKQITIGSATLSSSIFVLDITNSASPKLLWERPLPDGTLTTSTPVVVRLASAATEASKDENGKWYLVIGSGPTSITTNAVNYTTDEAKIYVFDLRNGDLKATISTGVTGVAVGDMMAVDMDSDYQVDDIYFGTYGGTGAAGIGKLYRLTLRNDPDVNTKSYQTTPSSWALSVAVAPGGGSGRPIFASPEIAQDALGNIWIYFGTGVYLSAEHATSPAPDEYLYGFKESAYCWKGITASCSGYPSTGYTQFLDATNITLTGAKATELGCFCAGNLMSTISCPTAGTCSSCGAGLDTVVTKVTDATLSGYAGTGTSCDGTKDTAAIDCLVSRINSDGCSGAVCDGWKRTITAQKSFSKPFVAGGLVDFTSFVPQSTSCSLGGSTRLWSLHYTTGTAYVQPTIFACDASGCSTATTGLTINASINLGTGVPPLGESLVALPLSGDTYKVITQVSGGLPGISMAPSLPAKSGYVLWIVK